MYRKGAGNDRQRKDVGNRMLCPKRNFSQAIHFFITRRKSSHNLSKFSDDIFTNFMKKTVSVCLIAIFNVKKFSDVSDNLWTKSLVVLIFVGFKIYS